MFVKEIEEPDLKNKYAPRNDERKKLNKYFFPMLGDAFSGNNRSYNRKIFFWSALPTPPHQGSWWERAAMRFSE